MANDGTGKKYDSVAIYRIRKLLSDLSTKTGRGTELVSLYLPPKKALHEAIAALREESGTASNIKSDTTRNHVQDALTKTMARLRLYKQTPENGIVIFCGAIPGPGGPGNETIDLFEVLPQKPVSVYLYRCDDHFHLDPLRDMLREQNVIGVMAVDATEAGLGIISGDTWDVVDTISSGVSGKTRKGGQCVSSDTLVQLQDGTLAGISKLVSGSKIASYDFAKYKLGVFECADTYSMVPREYYEITTKRPQTRIRATGEHRFFTLNSSGISTKTAGELKEGDRVFVTKKLPQPLAPSLVTHLPATFRHTVDTEGRETLKRFRMTRGLAQKTLAQHLELYQTEISQLERGERDLTWEKLQIIVSYLVPDPEQFNSIHVTTERILPEFFTRDFLQLLGYILGDGSASDNRIALYEQREDVARLYSDISRKALRLEAVPIRIVDKRHEKGSWSKNAYFETRIYSKVFADGLRMFYPTLISTESREIPEAIHRLDSTHLASFIRGLFDAEGHVRKTRIGISMKSPLVIRQLNLLLLRFGIISSYRQYKTPFGMMHSLDITDLDSIVTFNQEIGFSAKDKKEKLGLAAQRKLAQSYHNVPVMGSWVDKKAKDLKIKRRQFQGITNFFSDTRGISGRVFQRILTTFEDELLEAQSSIDLNRQKLIQEAVTTLSAIAESDLILAFVSSVKVKENKENEAFIDIELPDTGSFIGNGIVLHNSARRYERLREMELTDYFNRLADHAKKSFLEQHPVKGLIVSGPGPTKDEFVRDNYLDYRLQNVIVGTLDTGYAGREGVRETIGKSEKLLENVRVVEEKKLVDRFLREVNSDTGLAIYGIQDILNALKRSAVDTIIINDDADFVYFKATCRNCGNVTEKFASRSQKMAERQKLLTCPNCGSSEVDIIERDIVDYFVDASIDSGASVEVISSRTEGGAMLKNFGGVSAILRYRP